MPTGQTLDIPISLIMLLLRTLDLPRDLSVYEGDAAIASPPLDSVGEGAGLVARNGCVHGCHDQRHLLYTCTFVG